MKKMEKFWETKKLSQMSEAEWESLCDGCGLCCYRKIVEGWLWNKKILNTRVACNLLDCSSCKCSDYENRFNKQPECIKLNKRKIKKFKWLPETCAYRLISEGKKLFPWHPLISGNTETVKEAGITIENGIHENEAEDWYEFII